MADDMISKETNPGETNNDCVLQKITDAEGYSAEWIRSVKLDILLPTLYINSDYVNRVSLFTARKDDVWVCGFTRSGNHWLWEITSMLVREDPNLMEGTREHSLLGYQTNEHLNALKSPRILHSHLPLTLLPSTIWKNDSKIIYVMRNPKDCFVSVYHIVRSDQSDYGAGFEAFLNTEVLTGRNMLYGGWYRNVLESWEEYKNTPNVLFVKYEDVKRNPYASIKQIANFLGKSFDETFLRNIVEKTSFSNMKKHRSEHFHVTAGTTMRKGCVGDWKNHFTVQMNEAFDQEYEENMQGHDLQFDFELW